MEPLAVNVVGVILAALLSFATAVLLMGWKSLRNEMRTTRTYVHNVMSLQFTLLKKLHPDKAGVILEAIIEFQGIRKRSESKANGEAHYQFGDVQ